MSLSKRAWDQIKSVTSGELARALDKDGWSKVKSTRNQHLYRHEDGRRVSLHYHPDKTYGPNLLKDLLRDIGWTEADMKRLKLIK